jgi:hypothetical protein
VGFFVFFFSETRSQIPQADLELLNSTNPLASASGVGRTTGTHRHAQIFFDYISTPLADCLCQ